MTKHEIVEKQERATLIDCEQAQNTLNKLLSDLIYHNRPVHVSKKTEFRDTFYFALQSQGIREPFVTTIHGGTFVFENFQAFAFRLCNELNSKFVKLTTKKPYNVEIAVPISDLWKILRSKLYFYLPRARSEAFHSSAESKKFEQQQSYSFGSKETL